MKLIILLFPIILLFVGCNEDSDKKTAQPQTGGAKKFSGVTVELPDGQSLKLIQIRAGEVRMSESSRGGEPPSVVVRLTREYWLGQTPVTQGQWEAVMGNNPSYHIAGGPDAPVEQITWEEAMEFGRRVDEMARRAGIVPEGYVITLPSEAQWEHAARAGTTTLWWFGDEEREITKYAWIATNTAGKTKPVATKPHNPWGLYDMEGNVSEMTLTRTGPLPEGTVVDYIGPGNDSRNRVVRGGTVMFSSRPISYRTFIPQAGTSVLAADRNAAIGLRLAMTPIPH
jgi:formylglycine-generating enzyme required for sulfatase activity